MHAITAKNEYIILCHFNGFMEFNVNLPFDTQTPGKDMRFWMGCCVFRGQQVMVHKHIYHCVVSGQGLNFTLTHQ